MFTKFRKEVSCTYTKNQTQNKTKKKNILKTKQKCLYVSCSWKNVFMFSCSWKHVLKRVCCQNIQLYIFYNVLTLSTNHVKCKSSSFHTFLIYLLIFNQNIQTYTAHTYVYIPTLAYGFIHSHPYI